MSREAMAWVAGIFEGEGTVTVVAGGKCGSQPRTRLVVSVTSTDFEIPEFFMKHWPIPTLRLFTPKSSPNARPAKVWTRSCRKAAAFLVDIQPFIRTKRVQEKIALCLRIQSERRYGTSAHDQAYVARRAADVALIRKLNKRGTA